ncbi:hypothetical protein Tco_1248052 [Tanacetum coccineum]
MDTLEDLLKDEELAKVESAHAIVLDDSCLSERDLSCYLMGKIKDINAVSNLYFILANEGFENLKLSYIGGQWFLIELDSIASKEKISKNSGATSWFHELKPASNSFMSDERLTLITQCVKIKSHVIIDAKIKVIIKGQVYWIRVKELEPWSPEFIIEKEESSSDDESVCQEKVHKSGNYVNDFEPDNENDIDLVSKSSLEENVAEKSSDELSQPKNDLLDANVGVSTDKSGSCNFSKLKAGGSILEVMDELIKVRQIMGYNMDGPAVGYSGGILYAWDPTLFVKDSSTVSDSFVAVRALKMSIKQWISENKQKSYAVKLSIQNHLADLDKIIDQGCSNDEIVNERSNLLKDLLDV